VRNGILLRLCAGLLLAGQMFVATGVHAGSAVAQPANAAIYHILPGDALDISVWGESTLQLKAVRVLPDGSISFPLAGRVVVAGLGTTQVEGLLAKKLSDYLKEPQVTVMVSDTSGDVVYVLGKVDKPGPVALNRPMTVLQVLSVTGAFDKFADTSSIHLLRESATGQQVMTVNYDAMAKGHDLDENVTVEPGDTILVP